VDKGNIENFEINDNIMNNNKNFHYIKLLDAINLSWLSHNGQFRKDGKTHFIFHPIAVMMKVNSLQAKTVAVIHDILEDTTLTEKDLRDKKFDNQTIETVILLTRLKDQKYFDYIRKLSHNSLAKEVKIADVQHNLESLEQIAKAEERNFLKDRYKKTLSILNK
jgi:(p)ppGpp synthase/HD superfamily hydrolase